MAHALETATDEFLRLRLGAERIDDLPLDAVQRAAKKADYLLSNRNVVLELKVLTEVRTSRVRRVFDEFRRRLESSPSTGGLEPSDTELLEARRRELDRRLLDAVTLSVLRCARSANQQIAGTARTFALCDPIGVLVLVNERRDLPESFLRSAAHGALVTRKESGARELAHLDLVLVLTSPPSSAVGGPGCAPAVHGVRAEHSARAEQAGVFAAWFQDAWFDEGSWRSSGPGHGR